MSFSKPTLFLIAAVSIAAVTTGVVGAVTTSRMDDQRLQFRRPAELVADGRAEQDPVWKLGRQLFFDPAASGSGQTSCATCHKRDVAWADSHAKSAGDGGELLPFKTPTLLNIQSLDRLGWTGKFPDTPAVSLSAMSSAATMNMPIDTLVAHLRGEPAYVASFKQAFGRDDITRKQVGVAITRYVNSITSAKSPFDHWVDGDETAIGPDAKKGFAVFTGKGRCVECHSGWSFTDGSFHDIGTTETDPGRGQYFPTSVKLQHAFKTPSLRDVAHRAPYMHDGSKSDLDQVIDLYDRGGIARPSRAEAIGPLHLTAEEKSDLKAFLTTLSSGTDFVINP